MKRYLLLFVIAVLVFGCNSSILDDPSTTIRFSIPQPSHVKLSIENSYDTVIAVLVDEEKPAGVFDVTFNSSNLAEGIYFYTLKMTRESGEIYQFTKSMLLIK